jgi:hypothetical protein
MSLPLFSGILASLSAAIVLAPDDIPTCINQMVQVIRICKNIKIDIHQRVIRVITISPSFSANCLAISTASSLLTYQVSINMTVR